MTSSRVPRAGAPDQVGDLHDATVGIVGYGRIGQAVARRAESFGCRVVYTSRTGGVALQELLEQSDFVSLHCPLTE